MTSLWAKVQLNIYSLSDCNWTWTHNHLVHKRTPTTQRIFTIQLNHLANLAKWLSVRLWTKCCGFESSCSHLNFRFCACFEQGVLWHSGNYSVWIHSETRTWHDKNIQWYIQLLSNHHGNPDCSDIFLSLIDHSFE